MYFMWYTGGSIGAKREGSDGALCRAIGQGLWEIRTALPSKRIARVLLCLDKGALVALHAFIKKTQKTPDDELAVARKRQKELKS
jgi:phage-related protein